MDKWLASGRKRKLSSDSSKSNLENDTEINKEVTDFSSIETCQSFPQCDSIFPDYWSDLQWKEKLKTFDWLTVSLTGLGCSVCKSANNLGAEKSQGIKLASEWTLGNVKEYGETKEKKTTINEEKAFKP